MNLNLVLWMTLSQKINQDFKKLMKYILCTLYHSLKNSKVVFKYNATTKKHAQRLKKKVFFHSLKLYFIFITVFFNISNFRTYFAVFIIKVQQFSVIEYIITYTVVHVTFLWIQVSDQKSRNYGTVHSTKRTAARVAQLLQCVRIKIPKTRNLLWLHRKWKPPLHIIRETPSKKY